jgi:uncharacterized membrane protein
MSSPPPRVLLVVCAALVLLGIVLRFTNLGKKIWGLDETFTALRISGHSEDDAVRSLRRTDFITPATLLRYQRVDPRAPLSWTVLGLLHEEPQHPPLYYVVARAWARVIGDSPAATRALPALIGVLCLPAMFWLARELFDDARAAWLATALLAVSPFFLLYAQEARQYSLWALLTLASSAALLRALRTGTTGDWAMYGLLLALSFYTFLLAALVAVGHAIYVLLSVAWAPRPCASSGATDAASRTGGAPVPREALLRYFAASVVAGVLFLPWGIGVLKNRAQVTNTTSWSENKKATPAQLVRNWARQPGRAFFDLSPSADATRPVRAGQWFFTGVGIAAVLAAAGLLVATAPVRVWAFVLTLIGVTGAALVAQDVFVGGQGGAASTYSRYLTPCMLGFVLAVAWLLARQTSAASGSPVRRRLGYGVAAVFFAGSIGSCLLVLNARVWWNKGGPEYLAEIDSAARAINASQRPLVVSDGSIWSLLFVSHLLDDRVTLIVRPRSFSSHVPADDTLAPDFAGLAGSFSDVFLFPGPSKTLIARAGDAGLRVRPITFALREPLLRKVERGGGGDAARPRAAAAP